MTCYLVLLGQRYLPGHRGALTDGEKDRRHGKPPANFYWELMGNQPDHMPGYNDPLLVDDTQGDFGGNPIIHPESTNPPPYQYQYRLLVHC